MQLDKIIIALRKRTSWEAMDLGVILMRKLWPVLFFPWLILMSIVLLFVITTELQGHMYFAIIFMWWIKPVYESLILHVLSRGIFGEYVTTADIYTSLGAWLKPGVLNSIFISRFSLSRSFNLSVQQLEGLSGSERKSRLQALHRSSNSHSMVATIIGLLFELLFVLTLYIVIVYIAPETSTDLVNSIIESPDEQVFWFIIASVIYALTLFVLEPFYVAAGFMLYLNRRTQLEGWDIELEFRKIAQRIHSPHQQMLKEAPDV